MKDSRKLLIIIVLIIISIATMFMISSFRTFAHFEIKPLSENEINLYHGENNTVLIYPIFTEWAYKKNGFYDYYNNICSSKCLTVKIDTNNGSEYIITDYSTKYHITPNYVTGKSGWEVLKSLKYKFLTDIEIDQNPEILKNYSKIILLHNEYMTKNEFEAIKNHENVVYLYPNAMYAEVNYNKLSKTMTLIKGHGYDSKKNPPYPITNITNGFGYFTTSQHEYDINCDNYGWRERPNGMGLTCYPEYLILHDRKILETIKNYPKLLPRFINPD